MKAIIWSKYGGPEVLVPGELPAPEPKDNEVRIKICAATVTAGDCEMRGLKLPFLLSFPIRIFAGFIRPRRIRVLGQEFSGTVETVGKEVTRFKSGDEVFGSAGFGKGTYAEYICMPETPGDMEGALALKPENLPLHEAAAVPLGGFEALHFLRRGGLVPKGPASADGQVAPGPGTGGNVPSILINGAGGSIGTWAVQLAKHYGAEVTAVDSGEKLEMLRSIGAEKVIDYSKTDYTGISDSYDVIFDVVGRRSIREALDRLNDEGRYLLANPKISQLMGTKRKPDKRGRRVITGAAEHGSEDLLYLKGLIEEGFIRPVIDRTFPLEQTAEAHGYVESGAKEGNVIILIDTINKADCEEKQ